MFGSKYQPVSDIMQPINKDLNRFAEFIRFKVIKAGVTAAAKPIEQKFTALAGTHRGTAPAMRKLRGQDVYVPRPRFADSIRSKVWRMPDKSGYIAFVGPISKEVPHAHWFEKGTARRYTRTGAYRGVIPPYFILSRTYTGSIDMAVSAFQSVVKSQIENYQGQGLAG